jgi:hypothetical protein
MTEKLIFIDAWPPRFISDVIFVILKKSTTIIEHASNRINRICYVKKGIWTSTPNKKWFPYLSVGKCEPMRTRQGPQARISRETRMIATCASPTGNFYQNRSFRRLRQSSVFGTFQFRLSPSPLRDTPNQRTIGFLSPPSIL